MHLFTRDGVFDCDMAQFSYSLDGHTFINIGDSVCMPYQLKTFQGTRYALLPIIQKVGMEDMRSLMTLK